MRAASDPSAGPDVGLAAAGVEPSPASRASDIGHVQMLSSVDTGKGWGLQQASSKSFQMKAQTVLTSSGANTML